MDIKQLILDHWSELERKDRVRYTLTDIAQKIGVDYPTLNHVYNMRRPPTEKIIDALYDYFGDLRFYDVAGFERPDLMLRYVMRKWGTLSDDTKNKISKMVEKYTEDG